MRRTESFLGRSRFDPVLALDETFSSVFRRIVLFACGAGVFISLVLYSVAGNRLIGANIFLSFVFLCSACFLPTLSLGFWRRSIRYNPTGAFSGPFLSRLDLYLYEIVRTASRMRGDNFIVSFWHALARTQPGSLILSRLGISSEEHARILRALRESQGPRLSFVEFLSRFESSVLREGNVGLGASMSYMFSAHPELSSFAVSRNISSDVIARASEWVFQECMVRDEAFRWWSPTSLGRIPGIGKSWSYGQVPLLSQYARELDYEDSFDELLVGREKEIERIESTLHKSRGANILIVGEPGVGKHALLQGLVRMIKEGKIFPELEHKRVFMISVTAITATGKTKGDVEEIFIRVLNEAARAGNIILAIEDFPEAIESLSAVKSNAFEVFRPYLGSHAIQIIALANTQSFRKILEARTDILGFFEKIELEEPREEMLLEILKDYVYAKEAGTGGTIRMTYRGLSSVLDGALNYVTQGALPRRAIDLLFEVFDAASHSGLSLISADFVTSYISQKTSIPLGDVKGEEQEKLLNLEREIHARVVGQDEAVVKISDAIRRVRAGLKDRKRPIGTFLFLGPTGVGKTETAKALAAVYFGDEDAMARFDMSEYQNTEAFDRLIGSSARGESGVLTHRMEAAPYSLLLLDEFEKCDKNVRNLFLQILDEGFFTDAFGKRINMRNAIIIATSNAGSEKIRELVSSGASFDGMQKKIVSYIQEERIYAPELLNRFDAVIVFRPLEIQNLRDIARMMLRGIAGDLAKKNITFEFTDDLIEFVAQKGYDPAFGARPMRRFIQDTVEKVVSEKIIKGEMPPGSVFRLDQKDIP